MHTQPTSSATIYDIVRVEPVTRKTELVQEGIHGAEAAEDALLLLRKENPGTPLRIERRRDTERPLSTLNNGDTMSKQQAITLIAEASEHIRSAKHNTLNNMTKSAITGLQLAKHHIDLAILELANPEA